MAATEKASRRGGKPKGYQHTGRQVILGDASRRYEAEQAFIGHLNVILRDDSLQQLRQIPATHDAIDKWLTLHHVNAPCVRDAAWTIVMGVRSQHITAISGRPELHSGYNGDRAPDAWALEYERMNTLPVDTSLTRKIASEKHARARGVTVDVAFIRRAQQEDTVTAPVAADPIREDLGQFLARAEHHFLGRESVARRLCGGGEPNAPVPKLKKYVGWLVKRRFQGVTAEQIAADDDRGTTAGSVRDGIAFARALLQLQGRDPYVRNETVLDHPNIRKMRRGLGK